ncbi:MAG: hypothetical protein R3C13_11815 [Hyphomonas sp.]|uniref:hypothetical protein n=1 Tax=Hyphomonas sp. TaxID=87 RepID=UPI003526D9AE
MPAESQPRNAAAKKPSSQGTLVLGLGVYLAAEAITFTVHTVYLFAYALSSITIALAVAHSGKELMGGPRNLWAPAVLVAALASSWAIGLRTFSLFALAT